MTFIKTVKFRKFIKTNTSKTVCNWSKRPSSKYLQTINNTGKDVEKREPSCTVGNVN